MIIMQIEYSGTVVEQSLVKVRNNRVLVRETHKIGRHKTTQPFLPTFILLYLTCSFRNLLLLFITPFPSVISHLSFQFLFDLFLTFKSMQTLYSIIAVVAVTTLALKKKGFKSKFTFLKPVILSRSIATKAGQYGESTHRLAISI